MAPLMLECAARSAAGPKLPHNEDAVFAARGWSRWPTASAVTPPARWPVLAALDGDTGRR